jgi:ADP-heptose:LPS heptosyltransferase
MPEKIKQVAIIKPSAIGDTVLLSSLIEDIKSQDSEVQITLFTGKGNAIVVPFIEGIDHHIILPIKNPFKSISIIRENQFDLFIDSDSWPRLTAIYTAFARSKYRIGFKTKGQNRHYCFDEAIDHDYRIHEIDNYKNLIKPFYETSKNFYKLKSQKLNEEVYCIFHLWPSGYKSYLREWPVANWYKLAKSLGYKIYLTGSPAEADKNENFIKSAPEDIRGLFVNFAGENDFSKTMMLLKGAKLTVSVNTGIMHISAALGVKTIGLNGPTNPMRWGALGVNSINVSPEGKGHGFLNLGFEYDGQRTDSMEEISPQSVINEVENLDIIKA